ncbi:hypothetical protein PF008_g1843 [Phytophthora fragariae]|uniref:Fibronectin type-III domain-containing protein n=1 Tax=Phytophthora fragariae TaxID=53985 RepID=A0A6G0SKV9_9STRA|nr:hypothetical protein PF008_g1843 [Phytophthora fragariae]
MHQVASVWKRGACLVAQWWLLLAVTIASSTAQSTDPTIDAWATATGGALHIQWAISSAWYINNSVVDVEDFRVFVNDQERAIIGFDETGYDLYGLTSETAYTVQVQGTLVSGSLAAPLNSNAFPATTLNLAAPDTPDTPELLAMTGGFVQVSVQPPADTGGADLANMTVTVRRADGLTVVQQSQSSNSSALLTYNIYGLDALTTYWVTSVAVNEGGKTSSESNPVVAKTKALQLPDPCPPPRVIRTTGASVVLQLIPPLDDGGGRIQGYNVYMATGDVGGFNEVATTIGTDIFDVVEILRLSESSDEPLLPETRYIFKAVAINLVDICVSVVSSLQLASSTDTYTATAAVPDPPPSSYFLQSTGGIITMSLVKALNMQGATLTGFSIMIKDATGRSITSNITADAAVRYNATSLQASSSYDVSAAVVTNLGVSSFSAPTSMNTTAPSIPTAPRNITIVNITGSTAVAEWSMPLDTGGVDLAGYSIILMSLGSQEERPALASPMLLKDLVANTMYTVKMTVTNAAGMKSLKSESVATSFKTQSPTAPSEPFGISSIFSSGGAIEVSWSPPADRGGERLSTMTYSTSVYTIISCFDKQLNASHPCSTCNSVKLLAIQQYQLDAVTTVCEAPTSGVVCPDGTQDCCLTHAGSVYGFGLTCGRMESVRKPRTVVGTTSAVFSGLNCSSTYYFGVQAINGAGRSPTSLLQGLQTTSQTSPTYPVNLRQLTGTGGSIQLMWDAPSDSGGGAIVGYHIYRNYELLTPGYIQPPYTDCGGMVRDTSYVYGVIAVSASLAQGAMATTKLTTESVTPPLAPSLSIAGRSYNRLQLIVVTPCDTGGETALSYEYMVQDKGVTIAQSDFDCCDFTVENLMPKHSYSILVRVSNFLSASEWTKAIYTTTAGIPAVPVAPVLQVNTYSAVVALGKPPYDKEISSYDIYLRQGGIEIYQNNVVCQEDADLVEYVCPISYQLESLEPDTSYEISIRANGPLGSSVSSSVLFDTSVISNGTFGMEMTSYTVDKEGIVSTTVLRSDGTSGSVAVGVDVTQTDTVLGIVW